MRETYEFLALGGPLMVVIGMCSVASIAILIERLWTLQRRRVVPQRFLSVVRRLLADGKIDEAQAVCASNDSALSAVLLAGMKRAGGHRDLVRESMQDRGRREAQELERFTGLLGTIATISPLLGLLGTILGMIKTFRQVNATLDTGEVSAGALATGIWEALITTAAGLCVAIPAFLAYRFIIGRIDYLVADLEEVALDAVDLMADPERGGAE